MTQCHPSAPGATATLTLSVVIPTHNRVALLSRNLEGLSQQSLACDSFEVIVIDDGSVESAAVAAACARADTNVRLIRHEYARGPAAARNAGWRAARAAAVLFLDDDAVPDGELLRLVSSVLAERGHTIAGVEGQVVPDDLRAANASPFVITLRTAGGGHTCNIAYWVSALADVDGFDEEFPFPVGEDYDLAYRVQERVGPIIYDSRMLARHAVHGVRGVRSGWQQRRMARPSLVRLFLKHPDRFPPPFVPARVRPIIAWVLRRPSIPAIVACFVLQNLVAALAAWRILWRRPLEYVRWLVFLASDCVSIVWEVPQLIAYHKTVSVQFPVGAAHGRTRW